MEKIITVLQGRKKSADGLTRSSKLFKSILKAAKDKKAENIVSLDLKKIDEAVADFFILCEAQSHTQIKAIVDSIDKVVREECEESPYHIENGEKWTLVDYVNVVVHVFERDHRKFYNLESLWGDAGRVEHND